LQDLSPAGAFILTSVIHPARRRVRLCWPSWSGPASRRLETWGVIERVHERSSYAGVGWPGFALRFEPRDPEARAFVEGLLTAAG
jgi:hypothetical protein